MKNIHLSLNEVLMILNVIDYGCSNVNSFANNKNLKSAILKLRELEDDIMRKEVKSHYSQDDNEFDWSY